MTDTLPEKGLPEKDEQDQPTPPVSAAALQRLQSEAKAIAGADGLDRTKVHLVGRAGEADILVEPLLDWGDDWQEKLQQEDMRGWARAVLTPDELEKWAQCAPTIRQAVAFYAAWSEALGSEPGESPAS